MSRPAEQHGWSHRGGAHREEIRTRATPEQAWAAWADARRVAGWFTESAEGRAERGSVYTWGWDRFGFRVAYTVLEAEAPRWLVLHASIPGRGEGILEVTIEKAGGQTVVRLVNSGFLEGADWAEEVEGIRSGWHKSLAILKEYLENYFGRAKTMAMVVLPAKYDYRRLAEHFHREELLARWLTRAGGIGEEGSGVALTLAGGRQVTGRVIAVTPREVTLSWSEIEGTLELMAFSAGPAGRMLGLRALSWSAAAPMQQLESEFAAACARLAALPLE